MRLPVNRFKQQLAKKPSQIGFWLTLSNAYAAEAVAGAGFDWLLIDMEHSPSGVDTVLGQLQALAAYDTSALVRPPQNDAVIMKRLLDIGAQTLLVPYVQSVEEAQEAVRSIRYPPRGIRGVSATTRATRFGRVADYGKVAESELCLIVQVETVAALEDLERIAAVDGVDGVFFGPSDLAASMGCIGEASNKGVKAAVLAGIGRCLAAGRPAGLLTTDPDFAAAAIEAGASFVAVGVDAHVLARSADALAKRFCAGGVVP